MTAAPALPFAFARDNQVVLAGDSLLIGPDATMNGLREARRAAGAPLTPQELDGESFQSALAQAYDGGAGTEANPDIAFDLEDNPRGGAPRDLLEDPEDAPVIKLVNQLLRQAVRAQASDLHLEPHEDGLRARMRVDGTMQAVFDRRDVPARRVVSRLKVMGGLDIAETRLPQDGRIALRLGGRAIDVRLSTLPGHHGERVVMRLLDRRCASAEPAGGAAQRHHSGHRPHRLGQDDDAVFAAAAGGPAGTHHSDGRGPGGI